MKWILIGFCVLLAHHKPNQASFYGMATPLQKLQGSLRTINPYIKHWEAASYDRDILADAHQIHLNQQGRRRKRDASSKDYGPANIIKLNFFAHDREFRLLLRQDPMSVFSPDVEIENTAGPLDYDVSRVYTGSLEDDESSHVHAILTHDNLLDGTIDTATENFYIEPAQRYSSELPAAGVHSIVYKLSDVRMDKPPSSSIHLTPSSMSTSSSLTDHAEHCASERLRRKQFFAGRNTYENNFNGLGSDVMVNSDREQEKFRWKAVENPHEETESNAGRNPKEDKDVSSATILLHSRHKRWLPEELPSNRNPPLPLDLEIPYNDESSIIIKQEIPGRSNERTDDDHEFVEDLGGSYNSDVYGKSNPNHNIIVNDYNPNSDFNLRNRFNHNNNRNILVNTFHNNGSSSSSTNRNDNSFYNTNNYNSNKNGNTNFNSNGSGSGNSNNGSTSRPSHKTHVEIITKNGATKKPNIIVNNYNPDVILTSQNYHHTNLNLNVRNDLSDYGANRPLYEKKSTCMLYLQADHTFFNKMGSDEASIEAITRHVQRANSIYRNTDFNGDGKPDNITFMIKRVKVHNNNALKDPSYRFPGNYGVEKFLELFSEEDYDAFCLAYMFTYRDFEMGTLGLAWTGDLKNAGGVCEKNGHYRGSLKSLNTGIVTLLNYGKHVPPAVSHVTLAHEIGHNFGSPHDPEQCTPGGEDGNYIMFARATSGDKKNNNKFSPCSLKSIEPVLNAKARSAKGCFTEPQRSICGNGVVESGEQCDCGWEEDCKDSCCFPMSRHPRADEKPCTLTPRALCSPSQGPCCTTDCALKFGNKCRDDNGCRDPSFCDGRMPQCPQSVNKPNKTICNKEFVCYMGECTGSICLAYGLESCQCLPGPNDPKTKSCELCCKLPGETNPCKSSFEWNEAPYDVPDMFAKPGTPCNDYNGYCDVFQKCREVDPSGPLATLRKLLLSEESIETFKNWVYSNWYIVAIALACVVAILVIVAKLLGKRSNLKLKSVTIIHSATTETVRLPEDNNGVIVHTAVRTKVPFKKKVRGERSKSKTTATGGASKSTTANALQQAAKGASAHLASTTTATGNSKSAAGIISGKVTKRGSEFLKRTNRKKNRVSNDDHPKTAAVDAKTNKKSKKHKEVIDYSGNSTTTPHTNTFGRVHKWLLESPLVAQPLSHIEHSSKVRKVISKSQSTPERLVQQSPVKTKSLGNLSNEKVRLQVVYKPPFKFSLKLSKNSTVKTHVIGGVLGKKKRKIRTGDKKRVGVTPSSGNAAAKTSTRRAALLIRSKEDEIKTPIVDSEPNYETLNPKSPKDGPHYENLKKSPSGDMPHSSQDQTPAEPMPSTSKSGMARMNRSASNSQLDRQNSPTKPQASSYSRSNSVTNSSQPHHAQSQVTRSRRNSSSNSMNLSRNFGSTQNLIPSSSNGQGYLTKSAKKRSSLNLKATNSHDLARSNTGTNLSASRRHGGSAANLKRESSGSYQNLKMGGLGGNLSRNSSNSNLKSASLTRGSMSSIPRASLSNTPPITAVMPAMTSTASAVAFSRQTSLQPHPLQPVAHSGAHSRTNIAPSSAPANNFNINHSHSTSSFSHANNTNNQFTPSSNINSKTNNSHSSLTVTNNVLRPHTAAVCEDAARQFEWPKVNSSSSSGNLGFMSGHGNTSSNATTSHSSGPGGAGHEQSRRNRRNAAPDESFQSDLEVMVSDVKNLVS